MAVAYTRRWISTWAKMGNMRNLSKYSLVLVLLSLIAPTSIYSQTSESCTGSGKYCFGDTVYVCEASEPRVFQKCSGRCEAAQCVDIRIEPQISADVPPEDTRLESSDAIMYMTIAIGAIAAAFLFGRMVVLNRRK